MSNKELDKPLSSLTVREFLLLQQNQKNKSDIDPKKKYVYGITGLAGLFQCSIPTANRIKASGKIDKAIIQFGRKIIVDADLALKLTGKYSSTK